MCLGVFGVVASAQREVGGPRSGGVVVVVHSATGGVADVIPTERARRAESSSWLSTPPWAVCLALPQQARIELKCA